ncbi:MAG: DNA cytosine methyltransferase [Methyloprofundus sp.]|nr:DNA cytosine methyltransferase [Methyloprofundus sp.]
MATEERKKLTVVSMFSGCGGMDLGFVQAGYDVMWANDIDEDACETYRHNIGEIIHGDVSKLDVPKVEDLDVLTAGFPCQPFSNAGSRKGTNDPRGQLYQQTFKFIEKLKPKAIVFENVRGILSTKTENGKLIDEIVDTLTNQYGYHVSYRLLNFSHFGVPQNRIRVILIAVKNKNYSDHLFPEVIEDKDLSLQATLKGITNKLPNQTELMRLNPQALHYGSMIPEGGSWKDLPYDVLPERWKKIRDNMEKYHYPNFFRRYARNEIQGTITAAFKPENAGVWHPTKDRIFSVREIARIQTFPDDFVFHGRTIKSKYQQIGNSVPPFMAKQVAEQLKHYIHKTKVNTLKRIKVESTELNVNQPIHKQKLPISLSLMD